MEVLNLSMPGSFRRALETVRGAMEKAGLEVSGEWDIANDLQQDFGVALAACRVLSIYNSSKMLQNMVVAAEYSVSGPVMLAVCEREGYVDLFVRGGCRDVLDQVLQILYKSGGRKIARESAA